MIGCKYAPVVVKLLRGSLSVAHVCRHVEELSTKALEGEGVHLIDGV